MDLVITPNAYIISKQIYESNIDNKVHHRSFKEAVTDDRNFDYCTIYPEAFNHNCIEQFILLIKKVKHIRFVRFRDFPYLVVIQILIENNCTISISGILPICSEILSSSVMLDTIEILLNPSDHLCNRNAIYKIWFNIDFDMKCSGYHQHGKDKKHKKQAKKLGGLLQRNKLGFLSMTKTVVYVLCLGKYLRGYGMLSLPRDVNKIIARMLWTSRYEPCWYTTSKIEM